MFFSASNVRVKGEGRAVVVKRGFTFWLVQRVGSRRRETSLKVELSTMEVGKGDDHSGTTHVVVTCCF